MAEVTDRKRQWMGTALGVQLPAAGGAAAPAGPAEDPDDVANDAGLQAAVAKKDWAQAAMMLGGFTKPGMTKRINAMSDAVVGAIHKAACDSPDLGKNTPPAVATARFAHPTISPEQEGRAAKMVETLAPADQAKFKELIEGAKSPKEKQFITKGLAANHSMAELTEFAGKIAGKDAKWMQDNLSLTGDTSGGGVKQQWNCSCAATTFQAVKGELDPLYALKLHEENTDIHAADDTDGAKINPKLAGEQKGTLEAVGGKATNRNEAGEGMDLVDTMNKVSATTGLTYSSVWLPEGPKFQKGVDDINDASDAGRPVPLTVVSEDGMLSHSVLLTATDKGPPRYYKIHDPWTGDDETYSEQQLRKGKIEIQGVTGNIIGFEKPSPAAPRPTAARPAA